MLLSDLNINLSFECIHIIVFCLVGFAAIKTEDILNKKIVGWLKNNKNGNWYWHCQFAALIFILNYLMLFIGILDGNIYTNLTIVTVIRFVFIFNLSDRIEKISKLEVICCGGQNCYCCLSLSHMGLKIINRIMY